MKILFYISTIKGGGAAKVMTNLANHFCHEDDVLFVTNFPDQHEYCLDCRIHRYNIEATESQRKSIVKNYNRISKLRKIIKKELPDIVISFMHENNSRAIFANFGLKSKLIVSVRNDPNRIFSNTLSRFFAKSLYRFADRIVFQTEDARNWFPEAIRSKSQIILNQVDDKFFNIIRTGQTSGIVSIGRISKQKNHRMLLDAYAKIFREIEDDLYIYGEGVLQPELEDYAQSLGIGDRVHFCSFTQTPEIVYASAKCFVLPSDYEGLPNVLMEAMAAGVPCISTDCPCGGPKMLVENRYNGILVPVNDADKMAVSLKELLNNTEFASKISKNSRISAQNYKPDGIFIKWESFLDGIVYSKT